MAKKQTQSQQPQIPKLPEAPPTQEKANLPMTRGGFEITNMEQAWRFANALADSSIVPDSYKKKPTDCLVALDLASRLNAPWLAVMQHVYAVHGRPAMDSALCTALVNRSNIFLDPLDYEVEGRDPSDTKYKVRAFATRKSTGKVLYGPWITWELVKAERWDSKDGSKWRTMPDQMFHYRAASWFQRRHCPELTMGMLTLEEAEEVPVKHVDATIVEPGNEGLKKLLAEREAQHQAGNGEGQGEAEASEPQTPDEPEQPEAPEPVEDDLRDAETKAKVEHEKAKLQTAGAGSGKRSNLF